LYDFQQQWFCAKANQSLVATKARTRAASENVGAHIQNGIQMQVVLKSLQQPKS